jgi:hypothetical protein
MDLIGGIVVITSVFMVGVALVAFRLVGTAASGPDREGHAVENALHRRGQLAVLPLLIGFFIGTSDVFVTAQLPAIAFVNLMIGAAVIGILVSGSSRAVSKASDEEQWRR